MKLDVTFYEQNNRICNFFSWILATSSMTCCLLLCIDLALALGGATLYVNKDEWTQYVAANRWLRKWKFM